MSASGISISTNKGTTWADAGVVFSPTITGATVAVSVNGNKMMVTPNGGSGYYLSQNSGATWTYTDRSAVSTNFSESQMSADGVKLFTTAGAATLYIGTGS
jgi:serine/threonine protein phosphatase PrpC